MSTENKQEVAPTGESQDTQQDWKTEFERMKSTNERLLAESQANKTKRSEYDALKSELETIKTKKLEDDGNTQELLKLSRERNVELQSSLERRDNDLLKSNVFNAVSNAAKDAYDVNDLLAQSEYAKMIEVNDETLMPTSDSINSFVNSLKESKTYLFKGKKVASMADTKPTIDKPLNKSLKQMSDNERKQAMSDAIAQAFQPRN